MAYLGIDLGTSGLRALLVSNDGVAIGSSSKSFAVSRPHDGWSEQDPNDWVIALEGAVRDLRDQYPAFQNLTGIGVAGHMHGATLLDDAGQILRPCILWNDTRAQTQAAGLDNGERVRTLSGNIVFPGFTAPKMLWVAQNEPEVFDKVAKVLLPAAYLNYYLTGEFVADMSDSAGTSWLDVGARDWSTYLLDAGQMRRDQMPRLVEGSQPAGTLRANLQADWGLAQTVTVAGGAGDNAAAACGIGAMHEGQGFVSLGTSGVLLAARDGYHPAPQTAVHTFCHAVPDQWYQMGVMLCATDSLNWLSGIVGKSPQALTEELGENLHAPTELRFLPYLSGERTPQLNFYPDNIAIFMSSSGTTGAPRFTPITQSKLAKNLIATSQARDWETPGAALSPLSVAYSASSFLWLSILSEGRSIVALDLVHRLTELDNSLKRADVSEAGLAPSQIRQLLEIEAPSAQSSSLRYPQLTNLCSVGGPASPQEKCGAVTQLSNSYRMTYSAVGIGKIARILGDEVTRKPASVGKPQDGLSVRIFDGMRECTVGEVGEISVSNVKFNDRRPGDVGYFDEDGYLYITGRVQGLFCRNGINFNAQRLAQAVLADSSISNADVVSKPNVDQGDVVYLVFEGRSKQVNKVWQIIRKNLPTAEYPDHVVAIDTIPVTASLKNDLVSLRAMVLEDGDDRE